MTLQEQVARRLARLDMLTYNALDSDELDLYASKAAEVIRCMEWARRECAEAELDMDTMNEHPCGCCAFVAKYPRQELTLPPEGWKP